MAPRSRSSPRPPASRRRDREENPRATAVLERRIRALEEPLDVEPARRSPFLVLDVRNPIRHTAYRTMFPAYPQLAPALCTCADFARRGLGTCKHLAAAERWLATHADRLPAPDPGRDRRVAELGWAEIDRRLATPAPSPRAAVRLRWPGGALRLESPESNE